MPTSSTKAPSSEEKPKLDVTEIVEEHGDYLYSYAMARVRDQSFAEEIVQEAFLAAVKSINRFKGDSTVRTWLTGILKHKMYDALRKKGRDKTISFEEADIDLINTQFNEAGHWSGEQVPQSWGAEPDQLFERKEFMSVLEGCTQKLPEKLRSVFVMREVDGLSTDELCSILGIKSNNLWVILHRARAKLRDCVENNWLSNN